MSWQLWNNSLVLRVATRIKVHFDIGSQLLGKFSHLSLAEMQRGLRDNIWQLHESEGNRSDNRQTKQAIGVVKLEDCLKTVA